MSRMTEPRLTIIVLHDFTFSVSCFPTDHLSLNMDDNALVSISIELTGLVNFSRKFVSGDTFLLYAQTWNGVDLPKTVWTVTRQPDGKLGLIAV